MPEPEILRRCTVCGAASRPGALFCPQCGNAATTRSGGSDATAQGQDVLSEPPLNPGRQTRTLDSTELRARPQAEKLRKPSSVVLDEAAYDPSIRFVVVAAVLFVVFLVILVLSKIIT